ncbi:MAG: type 4a pilus biogenesis protein PilO [Desulfobacterales bacterium]|jgi:Tfp pilus assembly protein PilO
MALKIHTLDRACIALLITVSLVLGYWTLNWTFKQHRLLRQENELLAKKLKDLNLAETNLQHLKKVLDTARKELNILNERIPESSKIGEFLKHVNLLVNERNVNLISLQPQPAVEEKHCNRIPIRLVFEGPFGSVYQLLYDLETMNRMVVMETMQMTKTNKAQVCRVNVTASVFERH